MKCSSISTLWSNNSASSAETLSSKILISLSSAHQFLLSLHLANSLFCFMFMYDWSTSCSRSRLHHWDLLSPPCRALLLHLFRLWLRSSSHFLTCSLFAASSASHTMVFDCGHTHSVRCLFCIHLLCPQRSTSLLAWTSVPHSRAIPPPNTESWLNMATQRTPPPVFLLDCAGSVLHHHSSIQHPSLFC